MNYLSSYRKGWSNIDNWRAFTAAQAARDCHGIAAAVSHEGAERRPVDAYIMALRSPDIGVLNQNAPAREIEVGSAEFDAQQKEVHDLVELRDVPLSQLPAWVTPGLKKLSIFLKDIPVVHRAPRDFMRTEGEWARIQRGDQPREHIVAEGQGPIRNGRDLATYVHHDFPPEQWQRVANYLMQIGVPQRLPTSLHDSDGSGQSRFACWGAPFFAGVIGECVRRCGIVSFTRKWARMVPRPEEYAMMAGMGLLPQTYPEGSPMHPSNGAMHSIAAKVCAAALLRLFDGSFILPNGNTVEYEINLFADNIGEGRFWAGVHRRDDHEAIDKVAAILGQRIAGSYLN